MMIFPGLPRNVEIESLIRGEENTWQYRPIKELAEMMKEKVEASFYADVLKFINVDRLSGMVLGDVSDLLRRVEGIANELIYIEEIPQGRLPILRYFCKNVSKSFAEHDIYFSARANYSRV